MCILQWLQNAKLVLTNAQVLRKLRIGYLYSDKCEERKDVFNIFT